MSDTPPCSLLDVCRTAGRMDLFELMAMQNLSATEARERFEFVPRLRKRLNEVFKPKVVERFIDRWLVEGFTGILHVHLFETPHAPGRIH